MTKLTVDQLILQSCRQYPERIAFRSKVGGCWQETSYRTLYSSVDRLSVGLMASGLKPGHHAAIIAGPSYRWVTAYLAALRCGGIVVPIDRELKATELRHILNDSDARTLFTEKPYLELLQDVVSELPKLERIVMLDDSVPGNVPEAPVRELRDAWQRLVRDLDLPQERTEPIEALAMRVFNQFGVKQDPGQANQTATLLGSGSKHLSSWIHKGRVQSFSQLLQADGELKNHPASAERPAVILYTSGTTGQSKGAMLSHQNITFNIEAGIQHLGLGNGITTLSFLPINHVFEQVCGILLPLSIGGTIAFAESLKKIGENLAEIKPTFLLGVPAVYRLILDRILKNIRSKPLTWLLYRVPLTRPVIRAKIRKKVGPNTTFISGGAALDPVVAEGFEKLGLTLFQGYGITETAPIIAAESPFARKPGTVGRPMPGVEVKLSRKNQEGAGEILVKGPNVMLGYYRNQAATAAAIVDGWYHTGDLGRFDENGNLIICGRVKNLIVTANGKNVYPEEVENELLNSPYINEVMVYGHKTSPTSEEVYAIVYPDQEALVSLAQGKNLTEQEVEELIRNEVINYGKNLADYKRVRKFSLREDEFPKTTTRKIKRFIVEPDIPAES